MTQATDNDFQRLVLERLDKIDGDITRLDSRLEKAETKFDAYVKASEGMTRMATTIIITAGAVVIFGGVVDKADVLFAGLARLLGKG
ncbi:MAG: hypothetical protein KME35_15220 [Aphanocapsa sp. GSE-SYN-MK-11-07L]|jgi:hypothetical protein|nr:hypothetical protein [Aphanocapsa sp. GSE-SYN-MK-11-07L]